MGAIVEYAKPGDLLTMTVASGQSVTGGQMVELTGDRTVRAGQADSVVACGVAVYDGSAGDKVAVATDGVWPLVASGSITQGQRLVCAASGAVKAVPSAGGTYAQAEQTIHLRVVGYALEDAADGATFRAKLTL